MKTLLVGYKASDLFEDVRHSKKRTVSWLNDDVLCHTLDIYHRHAIEKVHHARAICSPHLPEGLWDLIKFKTGPKLMAGELTLDLMQEIRALKPLKFELEFIGRERDKNDLLEKMKGDRVRNFAATWPASVPGLKPINFTSFPGCFCHRRHDEGGLALAEVVSKELAMSEVVNEHRTLLDMGCGCGFVSLLIAASEKNRGAKPPSLVMVDSHSRAVEAATLNVKNLGFDGEVILADNGTPSRMDGTVDIFVGNPPYYSDYRIAEVFLETATRALKPGGVCYTVVKNAAGLKPVQEKFFKSVEVIPRRGYSILRSYSLVDGNRNNLDGDNS